MNTTPTEPMRIQLKRDYWVWSARFVNDLSVYELFDTDTIPTAFLSVMATNEVVARMQTLNPNHVIEVIS